MSARNQRDCISLPGKAHLALIAFVVCRWRLRRRAVSRATPWSMWCSDLLIVIVDFSAGRCVVAQQQRIRVRPYAVCSPVYFVYVLFFCVSLRCKTAAAEACTFDTCSSSTQRPRFIYLDLRYLNGDRFFIAPCTVIPGLQQVVQILHLALCNGFLSAAGTKSPLNEDLYL